MSIIEDVIAWLKKALNAAEDVRTLEHDLQKMETEHYYLRVFEITRPILSERSQWTDFIKQNPAFAERYAMKRIALAEAQRLSYLLPLVLRRVTVPHLDKMLAFTLNPESAEELADELGISRATLFNRRKKLLREIKRALVYYKELDSS